MIARKGKCGGAAAPSRARKGHGRQRQRLIEACISALHLYGPSRTTVEKVVAIAKMSPGIVRFYFDSKAAMLVASLQFLAAEFEEQVLVPVAKLKSRPVAALRSMVELYLDAEIASARKVSVWYAFWGEASSRQEYYDICGQKDESFAALVHELIERLIAETSQAHLDADAVALGLIGALEILWQDFAFRTERDIDRPAAKRRCMAYLRSVFPGQFDSPEDGPAEHPGGRSAARVAGWAYGNARLFAMERDLLFHRAWIVVGHESQIPRAGEFLTADTGVERALVVREASGAIRALRNSCPESPHALMLELCGRFEGLIRCARHGFGFSLIGTRVIGSSSADLAVLEVQVAGGLIFVRSPRMRGVPGTAAAHGGELAALPSLGSIPEGLMMLGPPLDVVVAADWKVLVEQWLESMPADAGVGAASVPHVWNVPASTLPGWSGARYAALMACRPEHAFRRQFMAPNQLLETRPDGLSIVQALPLSPGRSRLRRLDYTVLSPEDGARAAQYLARRLGPYARRAAREMAESVQKGLIQFGYEAQDGAITSAVGRFRSELAACLPALTRDRPPTD